MPDIFILLFISINGLAVVGGASTAPPLLLWGTETAGQESIFQALSSTKLKELLIPLTKNHMIIAYFAQNLTTNDFLCDRPNSGKGCYEILRTINPINYYSQALAAKRAIISCTQRPTKWHQVDVLAPLKDQMKELPFKCSRGQVHAYNFSDNQINQSDNLLAHDRFIGALNARLRRCPLIQLYTAHNNHINNKPLLVFDQIPINNINRDKQSSTIRFVSNMSGLAESIKAKELTTLRADYGILTVRKIVHAQEIHKGAVVYYERTYVLLNQTELEVAPIDSNTFQKGFIFKLLIPEPVITLVIGTDYGNWRITQCVIDGVDVYKPRDIIVYSKRFSYCCQTLTFYSEKGQRLSFYEVFIDVTNSSSISCHDPKFRTHPCWMCTKYLTPYLGATLLVCFILVVILCFGVFMLWDTGCNVDMQRALDKTQPTRGTYA